MNQLVIFADIWGLSLTTLSGVALPNLDACRAFATKNGYSGIWIRFGTTKHQVSIMIRKFRHQDQMLRKAGLSRKEIAGVRVAQRKREKSLNIQ